MSLQLESFRTKFRDHLGSATRVVDQAVESVESNVRWMDDNYKTISTWLENKAGVGESNDPLPSSTNPSTPEQSSTISDSSTIRTSS